MSKRRRKVAFVEEVDVEDKRRRGHGRDDEEVEDGRSKERSQIHGTSYFEKNTILYLPSTRPFVLSLIPSLIPSLISSLIPSLSPSLPPPPPPSTT